MREVTEGGEGANKPVKGLVQVQLISTGAAVISSDKVGIFCLGYVASPLEPNV